MEASREQGASWTRPRRLEGRRGAPPLPARVRRPQPTPNGEEATFFIDLISEKVAALGGASALVTLARTHNTGDNAASKDQYEWSQLSDEELNQLERILVKASVVA